MSLLAALVVWCSQQDRTAQRTEKADYYPAKRRCEEGEALLESDPKSAIDKFDEVLSNPKIKLVECRLRIEERPSEYTPWYPFLPYQYRGRAKINLAKKVDPEVALKLLTEAAADLQRSVKEGVVEGNLKEGVTSSDLHLKAAQAELAKVQEKIKAAAALVKSSDPAVPEPAIVKFRPAFKQILDDFRFKAARDFIDTGGKGLTDPEKKRFRDDADSACRSYLEEQASKLRRRLNSDLRSFADLQGLSARDLEVLLAVPKADDLLVADPAIEWARRSLPSFEAVRARKGSADLLLPVVLSAAAVEPDGENPWFATAESVTFQGMREMVQASVGRSRDALLADREKEKAAASGLVTKWAQFESSLDPKFREAHPAVTANGKDLALLLSGFPVDLAEVDKANLEACFGAASPEDAFAQLEQSLKGLESGKTVSRESRRKLYHLLFTASALRALCEGKSEDVASQEAGAYGQRLSDAGGALDTKKFGPRMEAVYAKLR